MNSSTRLLRQVNPGWLQQGRVTSQLFKPTPKDHGRLSTDDGSRISAEASFRRFTEERGLPSVGVMAVTVEECTDLDLEVDPDGIPDPEHVSIVFPNDCPRSQRDSLAKRLRKFAVERNWLHGPVGEIH